MTSLIALLAMFQGQSIDPEPFKIMPLGDSITYGWNTPGGWRAPFWNNFQYPRNPRFPGRYALDFVGTQNGNSSPDLPDPDHEGHGGWTLQQIEVSVPQWIAQAKPNIILLMAGTNDIAEGVGYQVAVQRLDSLIQTLISTSQARIYIGTLTIRTDGWETQRQLFNQAAIPVIRGYATTKRVFLVDFSNVLNGTDLMDTVHPNSQGYYKMGVHWAKSINQVGV